MNRPIRIAFLLLLTLGFASSALADCSETEMSAVFLISGVHDLEMSVDVLAVSPVGEATYPDMTTINASLQAIMPSVPPLFSHRGTFGNIGVFSVDPMDFGATALVDMRDGQVLFGGTVVWAGQGEVVHPAASTHEWFLRPYPAIGPGYLYIIPSEWPSDEEIDYFVDDGLAQILATDVMESFGNCGEYSVTAFFYLPTVGLIDPTVAQLVLVVQGSCGPPWNGEPVANEGQTWSRVKELFHR